jgi:NADH-quinone oxidoreductase subunit N
MDLFTLRSSIIDNQQSLHFVGPGIMLASILMLNVLVTSLSKSNYQQPISRYASIIGLGLAFYFSMQLKSSPSIQTGIFLFNHLLKLDLWASGAHQLLFILTCSILLIDLPSLPTMQTSLNTSMMLGGVLGAYLLVMANHWLIIYSSITLISVCSAVLISTSPIYKKGIVASFTYMIYQFLVSSMMLWGMAYLYGTGSLFLHASRIDTPLGLVGWCLATSPIFSQMGIFPFHFWIPLIYKQAHPNVIAYLTTIPKLAALAILTKLWQAHINATNMPYSASLQNLLVLLAIITLLLGHIGALRQKQPKDIIIYGSIAQGGWLLASILANTSHLPAVSYYSCIYGIMTIAAWQGLHLLHLPSITVNLQEYAGMGWKKPYLSLGLCIALLAFIGFPPTAGFTAKFLVLTGLWAKAYTGHDYLVGLLWLTCLLGSLLSLYYYLKIPYTLFFATSKQQFLLSQPNKLNYCSFFILLALLLGLFFCSKLLINLLPTIPIN